MRNKKHFFNIFLFIFNCIYVTSSTTTTYTFDQIETTNNEYNNNNSPLPLPTSHSMIIKEQEEKQFNLIDNNNDYISDTNSNNNNDVEMFRDIPASTLFIYKQNDQNEKTTMSKYLLKNILEEEKKDVKIEEVEIGEEDVNGDGVIIQMIKDNDNNNNNENEDRDVEINSEDAELSLSSSQVNVKWIKLSELTDIVDYVINTNGQDNKVI
jgi:hypothetical protein